MILLAATSFLPLDELAQFDLLREKIEKILQESDAMVGVGIMDLENRDTLILNGKRQFPMQSVYKFPLAIAVLHQVNEGRLSLDQKIHCYSSEWKKLCDRCVRFKFDEG